MLILKELVEFLRKGLEIYEDLAEDNGQCGEIYLSEEMMLEHKIVSDFCKKLETEYVQYQKLEEIQLYTLLLEEGVKVYTAVNSVIEVYKSQLNIELETIQKQQEKIKGVIGVISSISS